MEEGRHCCDAAAERAGQTTNSLPDTPAARREYVHNKQLGFDHIHQEAVSKQEMLSSGILTAKLAYYKYQYTAHTGTFSQYIIQFILIKRKAANS